MSKTLIYHQASASSLLPWINVLLAVYIQSERGLTYLFLFSLHPYRIRDLPLCRKNKLWDILLYNDNGSTGFGYALMSSNLEGLAESLDER